MQDLKSPEDAPAKQAKGHWEMVSSHRMLLLCGSKDIRFISERHVYRL